MPRTAVIGGTGFLGSALVHSLPDRTITSLSRRSQPPFDLLSPFLPSIEVDEVIYAVGSARNIQEKQDLLALSNALKALARPTRIIYLSSLAALPPQDGSPLSPYGVNKAEEENLLWTYKNRHAITVLRPCAVYGGGRFSVLLRFLHRYHAYPIVPSHSLALVSVEDLCSAVYLCLQNEESIGKSYVVLENYYGWKEVSEHFAQQEGITLEGGKALPHLGILDGLFHEWAEDAAPLRALGWQPRPLF